MSAGAPYLTYDLPLALVLGTATVLAAWASRRTSPPPPSTARPPTWSWSERPETVAYLGLLQGRNFYAVYGLWLRLAQVARENYGVRIDRRGELEDPKLARRLPPSLSMRHVVRDLVRAYYSSFRAEEPGWLSKRWPWLLGRQRRAASRDFAKVASTLAKVLPALEAP